MKLNLNGTRKTECLVKHAVILSLVYKILLTVFISQILKFTLNADLKYKLQ